MILEQIEFWHWWVAAILFIVIEVFAPGAIFLWMGVAAGVVGAALLAVPATGWEIQFLVFAVLSVGSVIGWRAYQRRHPVETDHPTLNLRGQQYVGRQFTLVEPIVNGTGVLNVDDTRWKVRGEDLPAGSQVTVTGVEGTVLTVERA
ncbi:MAG: NfeD family protein [Kiloniellales bacterium]|nr:NfeD family protein [Kiloniellales bacterium]